MLTNRALPALYNGVSQQPASIRHSSQGELVENALLTVADGVRMRPNTRNIARLMTDIPSNMKVHHIFASPTEHYIVVFADGSLSWRIKVFNGITGAEITVDTSSFPGVTTYLNTTDSITDLYCLTVADTTFIVNRAVTTATFTPFVATPPYVLYVTIKQGGPEATYKLSVTAGATVYIASTTTTTVAATQSTIAIATALAANFNTLSTGFTCVAKGSLILVNNPTFTAFPWEVTDSLGNAASTAFANQVERYSDLPRDLVPGAVVEVKGTGDAGGRGSFWVRYVSQGGAGKGYYEETLSPAAGEPTQFQPATMPVALAKLAGGTFQLQRIPFADRLVGSTLTSAPVPSFIGQKITSVFFHRNRLGFTSDENIIMSRAGNLYNFWPKTGVSVNDDDPIDVTVNAARVSILRHAVSFNKSLMLISDNVQFQLSGGEILTPRTVRADIATEYSASRLCPPVSGGRDLYFPFDRTDNSTAFAGLREYTVDPQAVTNVANDVTEHVPQYIPANIFRMSSSNIENMLVLQSKNDLSTLYLYRFLWDGEKKVQSAWTRWPFGIPYGNILSAEFDRSVLHLVVQRGSGTYLERIDLQQGFNDSGIRFPILVDRRQIIFGSYDGPSDRTTFTFPDLVQNQTFQIIAGSTFGSRAGSLVLNQAVGASPLTSFIAPGNWSTGACYAGISYTMRYRFSQQYFKDQQGVTIADARVQLRNYVVQHRGCYQLTASVSADGRTTEIPLMNGLQIGGINAILGRDNTMLAPFKIPVLANSQRVTVELQNTSPYPCSIQSAEWNAQVTLKSKRR